MKRKEFIRNGLLAGLTAGALVQGCTPEEAESSAPAILTQKKLKWKMVTTWPPNFPILGEGCLLLAQWINEMSGGRLTIDVYGGGELVPALQVFEAVSSGAVEMGHGSSYYWAGIQPALQFFASVPFGMNAQQMTAWLQSGGGQELWEELYARYNIQPFFSGNTGAQMGGWFNRRIASIDDFRGLKMRMPGLGGKILEKAGATVVLSPGGELYTNLERGVIDATEWIGPYHDYLMGFHKIAKYYYSPGWHESGTVLETMVNKRDYEALPDDLKAIVRAANYRLNTWILSELEANNYVYIDKIQEESSAEILIFPDEVITQLKSMAMAMYDQMIAKDEWTKRVFESFWSFKKNMSRWSEWSEKVFYNQVQ